MIFSFDGYIPVIHESSYVHPQATVVGNVIIGAHVYIGPGAAIRGDWGEIRIADGCNIQENCTIHMFPGRKVSLHRSAHVGHGAVIHGATLGENCLIGMNAVVMDEVIIGKESIIGALTFIKAKTEIPDRSLVVGNPGTVIKTVSDEMIEWKTKGTKIYQGLPEDCRLKMKEVQPLREEPKDRPPQQPFYDFFN